MKILAILLLICNLISLGLSNSCLRDMIILASSSSSISVRWNYTCPEHRVRFKVYYEHKRWMTCAEGMRDEKRGPGRGNIETEEMTAVIENLHPYSIYYLSMKALASHDGNLVTPPEESTAIGETLRKTFPEVAPANSNIPTKIEDNRLKFFWNDPLPSSCSSYGTDLDGTYFILRGKDPWNVDEEQRGSTMDHYKEFDFLQPFSTYEFLVFAQDKMGRYNKDVFLKQEAQTKPGQPSSPRDLHETTQSLKGSRENRQLKWFPPYPPTGEIQFYSLRWKESNSTVWQESVEVLPSLSSCELSEVAPGTPDYNVPVCHTLVALDATKTYVFQVSAKNYDILQPSMWSLAFYSEGSENFAFGLNKTHVVIIAVVSLVSIILIILVATVVKFKCFGKNKYKNVPNYEMSAIRTSGTAVTTLPRDPMLKYQHHLLPSSRPSSIQEQPLPPLPKDDHTYEELKLRPRPEKVNQSQSNESDDEDVLQPTSLTLNVAGRTLGEEAYLAPRGSNDSTDTLDVDDYLKPTCNRFEHIDTRDIQVPKKPPPPIPKVSYTPPAKKPNDA